MNDISPEFVLMMRTIITLTLVCILYSVATVQAQPKHIHPYNSDKQITGNHSVVFVHSDIDRLPIRNVEIDPPRNPSNSYSESKLRNDGTRKPFKSNHLHNTDRSLVEAPSLLELLPLSSSVLTTGFDAGIELSDESGSVPPDTHGAAGPSQLVIVTNSWLKIFDKTGGELSSTSLRAFFNNVPNTSTFDPKAIYDHQSGRFIIVTLEKTATTSVIYLAASQTSDATGTWNSYAFDVKLNLTGDDSWFDYPGLAVDEEAVYLTGNYFTLASNAYKETRLLVVNKSDLYSGTVTTPLNYHPKSAAGDPPCDFGLQPARIYSTNAPGEIGTYLTSYSGCSDGTNDYLSIFRIDDPLGTGSGVVFRHSFVDMGYDAGSAPSDAAQAGGVALIATNDQRTLDSVYEDDRLWVTFTSQPASGINSGQATAHAASIDISDVDNSPLWQIDDVLEIGGEFLGTSTSTFFPAINISQDFAIISYCASSANIFAGSYFSYFNISAPQGPETPPNQTASLPATGVETGEIAVEGMQHYSISPNRWGDYSGSALDPVDGVVWSFNQFAKDTGAASANWGTYIAQFNPADLLPVELTSFEAESQFQNIELSWTTASELNNAGFYLERIGPNNEIVPLVFVTGNGTSSEVSNYQYELHNVDFGIHTFRLKQVDFDGKITYSDRVEVEVATERNIELSVPYPNPSHESTLISFASATRQIVEVQLFDLSGRHVRDVFSGYLEPNQSKKTRLSVSGLASGKYYLRMTTLTGNAFKTLAVY